MTPVLEARNLSKSFMKGGVNALCDVSLGLGSGESVLIQGASGSGKSTLLHVMAGLLRPDSGEVRIHGKRPKSAAEWARVRARQVGIVFQSFHLLPTLNAQENVILPMLGVVQADTRRQRAEELLDMVDMSARQHHLPSQLSGGEQQRISLARALANRPSILLADEPTGNLDSVSAATIVELLLSINHLHGVTLVMVTHERDLADRFDRVFNMRDGVLVPISP